MKWKGITIKVGDRLRFKAATRWNCAPVWRKVNGFDWTGRPTVRYGGWSDFTVMPGEILEVEKA